MGWDEPYRMTKAQVVEHLLSRFRRDNQLLDHALVGNHLWSAVKHTDGHTYVVLSLLQKTAKSWAYKTIDEVGGPYYLDCPERIVSAASENPPIIATGDYNWREVRRLDIEARRNAKKTAVRGLVLQHGGSAYRLVECLGRSGWRVECITDHKPYRMTMNQVYKAIREMMKPTAETEAMAA